MAEWTATKGRPVEPDRFVRAHCIQASGRKDSVLRELDGYGLLILGEGPSPKKALTPLPVHDVSHVLGKERIDALNVQGQIVRSRLRAPELKVVKAYPKIYPARLPIFLG